MIVCIIQARMGSTRFPGKVLRPILGKPMLARQIERVQRARLIDKIIVATTNKNEDNPVALVARHIGVNCFRGDEKDVLDRYYRAAKKAKADIVARLTGDCPFSDPEVIDETVDYFLKRANDLDYTSKPTNYPEGLDVEVFSFAALERSWREGKKPSEREHVTPYIYTHPEIFKNGIWQKGGEDFSKMHLSVDTAEDFIFATKIFESLYRQNPFFSKDDIAAFLRNRPDLLRDRNGTGYEGYKKSLKDDEDFQRKNSFYQKLVGFIPGAIFVLSGGIIKDINQDGLTVYRSTKENEGDYFGVLWGEARIVAAAKLAACFPQAEIKIVASDVSVNNEPTEAKVIGDELEKLFVSRERMAFVGGRSQNTASQIKECLKIIRNRKWRKTAIVTNEYHKARASAIFFRLEKNFSISGKAKKEAQAFLPLDFFVSFVGAESVLAYRDKKYKAIIKKMRSSSAYKIRIKNEKKGVKMVLNGEYGKLPVNQKDKTERKI